jgi:hypothetical protein
VLSSSVFLFWYDATSVFNFNFEVSGHYTGADIEHPPIRKTLMSSFSFKAPSILVEPSNSKNYRKDVGVITISGGGPKFSLSV